MNGVVIFEWGEHHVIVRRDQILHVEYKAVMERILVRNIYGTQVEIELDDDNISDQDATAAIGKDMIEDLTGVGHPAGGGLGTKSGIAVWRQHPTEPTWQRELLFP